ncbi:hypothetical protein [Glycomyces salinus]|uniref:hypothetical protein n=1 Tax=Glycomyces salinus TaxID=980294 RepID=UPI0018EB7CB2|nr:hypothetical protein [Glycomyces salinus]
MKRAEGPWPTGIGGAGVRVRHSATGGLEFLSEFRAHRGGVQDSVIPVAAVDSRPQAVGFGEWHVRLRPGCHLVTVQTQESDAVCCSSWPFRVEDGDGTVELEYASPFIDPRRHEATRNLHGVLGGRGIPQVGGPAPGMRLGWAWSVGILACIVSAVALGRLTSGGTPAAMFAAVVVPLVIGGVVGALYAARLTAHKAAYRGAARRLREAASAPEAVEWDRVPGSVRRVWCLPHGGGALPRPSEESGLIVLHPRLRQRTEPFPIVALAPRPAPQSRSFTAPPDLRLDGDSLASGWATWIFEVAPGEHRVEAAAGAARADTVARVGRGDIAELALDVVVTKRFSSSNREAEPLGDEYSMTLKPGSARDVVEVPNLAEH